MKFTERYEIQEMVTSGRVSTFVARDRNSHEAVVVSIFEVAKTSSAEVDIASIIARFESLAPTPPGIIVETGFDEASSSAFITTKMPAPAALQQWVAAYHNFGKTAALRTSSSVSKVAVPASNETAELSAKDLRAHLAQSSLQPPAQALSQPGPPARLERSGGIADTFGFEVSSTTPAQSQSPGEFTRLFRELNAFEPVGGVKPTETATDAGLGQRLGASPLGQTAVPPTPPPVPSAEGDTPGAFTRDFLGLSSTATGASPTSIGVNEPTPKQPGAFTREFLASSGSPKNASAKVPPPQNAGEPSIFTKMFGWEAKPSSTPSFEREPPQKESKGEFTSYFQDPFEHPNAQGNAPAVADLASVEVPEQRPSDFTNVFGHEATRADPIAPNKSELAPAAPGCFTEIFEKNVPPQRSPLSTSVPGKSPIFQQTFTEPATSAPGTPAPPTHALDMPLPAPSRQSAPGSNATFLNSVASSTTNIFNPQADAPPIEDVPQGPSEFTSFLNRGQLDAMLRPAPGALASPAGGQASPPIPNSFMAPPPPPTPPVMAAPPMPAVQPVPWPPAPPAVPPPRANTLWPLITVLTILLSIAVILVMYFAMKH